MLMEVESSPASRIVSLASVILHGDGLFLAFQVNTQTWLPLFLKESLFRFAFLLLFTLSLFIASSHVAQQQFLPCNSLHSFRLTFSFGWG